MKISLPLVVFACLAPVASTNGQECGAGATGPDARMVHGIVRNASGVPLDGARVTATWIDSRRAGSSPEGPPETAEVRTDLSGAYRFCGLPRNSSISIRAVAARTSIGSVTLPPSQASDVTRADFPNHPPNVDFVTVRGVVRDTAGATLAGARLAVNGGTSTSSDDAGRFELNVPRNVHSELAVRLMGFKPRSVVIGGTPTPGPIDVVLERIAVTLKPVTVATLPDAFESVSGFGERRRRGTGAFFDRADLERLRPQTLTDVLRSVGGIQVHTAMTRWGYQTTPSSTRATGGAIGCSMDYYVNGHQYTPTSMGIDRDMPPSQIEAIEVYKSSETPPQFLGPKSRCGVVVIWTRYRAHELDG